MELDQMLDEIREINIRYLLLIKKMLLEDRDLAIINFEISPDIAVIIENLSSDQLVIMASTNMFLCRFHFEDRLIYDLLSKETSESFESNLQMRN